MYFFLPCVFSFLDLPPRLLASLQPSFCSFFPVSSLLCQLFALLHSFIYPFLCSTSFLYVMTAFFILFLFLCPSFILVYFSIDTETQRKLKSLHFKYIFSSLSPFLSLPFLHLSFLSFLMYVLHSPLCPTGLMFFLSCFLFVFYLRHILLSFHASLFSFLPCFQISMFPLLT